MNSSHIICEHRCTLPTQHVGLAGSDSSICKCEVEQAQRKERKWVWARAAREKEGERGKEAACSEERRGERTGCSFFFFYSVSRCIVEGGCRNVSIHGDRWQTPERGRWMEEWQLPPRHTMKGDGRMRKVLSLYGWRGVWQLCAAVL